MKSKSKVVRRAKAPLDPFFPACDLIPVTETVKGAPALAMATMPPNTYYRVDRATKEVRALVTLCPDRYSPTPVHVGWFECGQCGKWASHCRCASGLVVPRSVEYIWDSSVALCNNEEWGPRHANYMGTLRRAVKPAASVPFTIRPKRKSANVRPSLLDEDGRRKTPTELLTDAEAEQQSNAAMADLIRRIKRRKGRSQQKKGG